MKDSQQMIITKANDREFFPLVNGSLKRFLLYLGFWIIGTCLTVGPAWAICSLSLIHI